MSSINERYEQFRKSQKGADGSSAYVQNNTNNETPSPIGVNVNSNPVKDRKNEAVILEGGAITTRGLYEQQRRVEQKAYADSKRAYISETKRLEAQGYTRSSVDPKTGEETWTRKQQAQERAADLATVAQKKTYTPLEQAYRGAVQYNVAPFSGFAAQLGDVTGNKGLSQGAKDFEKTLKFDQNPAVGPLSGVLDLASLGFANLTGDRKGQIEAKRKLAYDFSSIKERPYEYGAASATDAAGLLVGATEIKGAAKAGTTAATRAIGELKSIGGGAAKQGSHFIPEAMSTSYKGAQAADALKIMKPSGPKAPNKVSEALSLFSPTNRKLASAEKIILPHRSPKRRHTHKDVPLFL